MESGTPRNKLTIFLEHLVKTARNIDIQYPFVDPAMLTYFLQTVQQLPAVFQKEVKQMGLQHNIAVMNRQLELLNVQINATEAQVAVLELQLQRFAAVSLWFQYCVRSE